uniref:Amidohydro-rel domain-containing protein n=1 Tax=Rhabditophanes sp. KR3021 TaxID=114890 RepID=A0AC35U685_9BILA
MTGYDSSIAEALPTVTETFYDTKDLENSFYVEKLSTLNLDEMSEEQAFGHKSTPNPSFTASFNASFTPSIPTILNEQDVSKPDDKDLLISSDTVLANNNNQNNEILLLNMDESKFDKNDIERDSQQRQIFNVPIEKKTSGSKKPPTRPSSSNSNVSIKNDSPSSKMLTKPDIKKKVSCDNSPRIHNTSGTNESSRLTAYNHSSSPNLNNIAARSSPTNRMQTPTPKNVISNDSLEDRPTTRLNDRAKSFNVPANRDSSPRQMTKQKSVTAAKPSNRNPFATSDAMLALFGDPKGTTASCLNQKTSTPNPALNKNHRRTNILEREKSQPTIFPNTQTKPTASRSAFSHLSSQEKAYEEAKKRGKCNNSASQIHRLFGYSENQGLNICGPEQANSDDENESNSGVLVTEESSVLPNKFISKKANFENIVGLPGADIYNEDLIVKELLDEENMANLAITDKTSGRNVDECAICCSLRGSSDSVSKEQSLNTPNYQRKDNNGKCPHNLGDDSHWDNDKDEVETMRHHGSDLFERELTLNKDIESTNKDANEPAVTNRNDANAPVLDHDNDKKASTDIINDALTNQINGPDNNSCQSSNLSNLPGLGSNEATTGNDTNEDRQLNGDNLSSRMVNANSDVNTTTSGSGGGGKSIIIKNGQIVNDDSIFIADILIQDNIIKQVGINITVTPDAEVIDASNKYVIPAGIDVHTEFSNSQSVDDFDSGSKAAIAGGTATVIDVVIPRNEGESLIAAFERVKVKVDSKSVCNTALSVMILAWNGTVQKEMDVLVKEKGVNSFILNIAVCSDDCLYDVMDYCKKLGVMIRIAPENKSVIKILERKILNLGITGPEGYVQTRPIQLEADRVTTLGTFSNLTNCPVSILSLTSNEACHALTSSRISGSLLTAEVPVIALVQDGNIYYDKNFTVASNFITQIPLRQGKQHANALLNILTSSPLAMCVSEHKALNTATRANASDFTKMPAGIPAVEERLAVLWEKGVCSGVMDPMKFVAVTSSNAAKAFNLYPRKGRIAVGADADLAILDTTYKRQISVKSHMSASDYNAFEQLDVHCQATTTICNGNIVYQVNKPPAAKIPKSEQYLALSPNSPHIFSLITQREKMSGRVEKVDRSGAGDSRKSSTTSIGQQRSGSGLRNQFESTINNPVTPNPRLGTKIKNPPGGVSSKFW